MPGLLLTILLAAILAWPQPAGAGPALPASPAGLELKLGHTRLLDIPAGIKRVSVGKDDVCDVVVISPRQLYLVGKEVGSTTITLWDTQERVSGIFEVRVARNLARLKEHLHQILPNEPIEVREMEGTVLLSGRVSSQEAKTQAETLAKAAMPRKDLYDTLHAGEDTKQWVTSVIEVGGHQQVNIKVRFAEVKRDITKRMKSNIGAINPLTGDFFFTMMDNLITPSWDAQGNYSATYSTNNTMIGGFNIGGAKLRGALDVLKENKMAKILAEPTLVAVSGHQAEFLAGGEFPVPVPQKDTITIEFKKFGVQLGFKPEVLKDGRIRMTVTPEVSEMDFSIAVVVQNFTVPGLKTRKATTQIELADGETFAIAGLFRDDISHVVGKIPLLGDIPILGALFRSTEFKNNLTELVIVVTPEVVKQGGAPISYPTDNLSIPNTDFDILLWGSMTEKTPRPAPLPRSGGELEGRFGHEAVY